MKVEVFEYNSFCSNKFLGNPAGVCMDEGFSKEEKQDLMHIAMCKIMEPEGYFQYSGMDGDGWPLYKKMKSLPNDVDLKTQENYLKSRALDYFENIGYII